MKGGGMEYFLRCPVFTVVSVSSSRLDCFFHLVASYQNADMGARTHAWFRVLARGFVV